MKNLVQCVAGVLALGLPLVAGAGIVNIQFNGARNVPGPRGPAPHYIGQGAAGGGTNFNTLYAISKQADGTDNDNLTVGGTNLVDSLGNPTTVTFTVSPVGGDDTGPDANSDPTAPAALLSAYVFNNSAGNHAGESPFQISGLGSAPSVDLYFYYRSGGVTIPGATKAPFTGRGIFTSANTLYFKNVPITNGIVAGTFGNGVAVIFGMSIVTPDPHPFVVSTSPSGTAVKTDAVIAIQLQDYVALVATNSIQLSLNGQLVTPAIGKLAGANLTTITYAPAGGLAPDSTNTVRLIFGDNASPPFFQTNVFSFGVLNPTTAAGIINIDFNGARNVPGPRGPGPAFVGQGAAGGGTTFNVLLADSKLPDGTDDDNLTVSGANLLNSLGTPTTVSFTVSPVGGDDTGPAATGDPTDPLALLSTYVFNNSASNHAGESPFTISGLEGVPSVDLYFYFRSGGVTIPGATAVPFAGAGVFTSGNTLYFPSVPVINGAITGTFGSGTAVIFGMTIRKPPPGPYVISTSPTGTGVSANAVITVNVADYVSQVATNTIQLLLNGGAVVPTISKPAGTNVTTISYAPPGLLLPDSTNTVRIIFSDSSKPPLVKTNEFSFVVINEISAATIVNIDFNGARNVPGPRGPGPTFVGPGAAGGGTTFNGIQADSRLADGTDEDNLTVSAANLLNSLGKATAVSFTISPVGGDDAGAPAGTASTVAAALLGDYIFVGSAGQITGKADFTISGLGAAPTADLYFYFGANGNFSIPGTLPTAFSASGIFTSANTRYFKSVPVSNGTITGTLGSGPVTLLYGLTIKTPLPRPIVVSRSPTGSGIRTNAVITVVLQDYITQVAANTIQLFLNGQLVKPAVDKPAGNSVTTVSYDPRGVLQTEATNTVRVVFSDTSNPPIVQTNDFSFGVISDTKAATIINIDINGARNVPGPRGPGPTFVGQGAAGGGTTFNGILADSRVAVLTNNNDNLTISAANLLNSIGNPTTVSFTISPVGGDDAGAPAGTDPTATAALFGDYIFVGSAGQTTGKANFTIGGLGTATAVDLYFYFGANGNFSVAGAATTAFSAVGIFTSANTRYFKNVPVSNGTITGTFGTGPVALIYGLTIVTSPSPPQGLGLSRQGNNVVISWPGTATLQTADAVTGPWADVPGATSPRTVAPAGIKFYRLKQ